jgi:pSer/pThr/pTyr-binding forkhead associated (FHA) protein
MAHIQVFYRDLLKGEVELLSDETTIGRNSDSDITIDNAGVSARHARIIREGDDFIIEDTDSRNGTFVNGKRVTRQLLSEGDEVVISKHILKLTNAETPVAPSRQQADDAQHVVQSATVEVDVSSLGELLKQRQANFAAYLLLTGMQQNRSKYPLTKLNFKIGKSIDADITTPGWFAPRISARVVCKTDGFYIVPERRGKVRVNGMGVLAPMKLEDNDRLSVRGLSLTFYNRPVEKSQA